ncbi:hypothetical protein E2I00_006018 [Balaenoptera physalus]|uniref:Uncharacterized protein n=1 Tax=Balaenoptera physalus TaxID=9770 RepID=A0A6A1PYM6_BALPH|nr:hypothetical protein E2I00_006018 [Balaenoptera physalus]
MAKGLGDARSQSPKARSMAGHLTMNFPSPPTQFVKFANIEEDTPSYHRSYDFFVSRFSEMCHSGHEDLEIKTK